MIDYYLRTTTEAEMLAALKAAAVIDGEGHPYPGMELSVIGKIVRDAQELPGWHVNLRVTGTLLDSQVAELPAIAKPSSPVRVWFDCP